MTQRITGHLVVDAIAKISFEGDVTPCSWYKHICYQTTKSNKKCDYLAVNILADIVYWYRPYEKRHELTGESLGWFKKFAENELRRSPEALARKFNTSVKCIRESIKVLIKLGLITVLLKPVKTQYGTLPNVMYISANPNAIAAITYRTNQETSETLDKSLMTKWATSNAEIGNKELRNGQQATPKSETSSAEIVTSSIYRDFNRNYTETSSPPTPPQGRTDEREEKAFGFQIQEEVIQDVAIGKPVEVIAQSSPSLKENSTAADETQNSSKGLVALR